MVAALAAPLEQHGLAASKARARTAAAVPDASAQSDSTELLDAAARASQHAMPLSWALDDREDTMMNGASLMMGSKAMQHASSALPRCRKQAIMQLPNGPSPGICTSFRAGAAVQRLTGGLIDVSCGPTVHHGMD